MVEATKSSKYKSFTSSFSSKGKQKSTTAASRQTMQEESKEEPTTNYWTVSYGAAVRNGWSCRACRKGIAKG